MLNNPKIDKVYQKLKIGFPPLRGLAELIIFYLISFALEYYIFREVSAWHEIMHHNIPHPFWLSTLVFGSFYGLAMGVFSAFSAAGLTIFFFHDIHTYNPLEWGVNGIFPLSMIILGVVSGLIRHYIIEKVDLIEADRNKMKSYIKNLDNMNMEMIASNLRLERKIVSRADTFQSLYEAAKKLTSLNLRLILKETPLIINEIMGAQKSSLYLRKNGNGLELKGQSGWNSNNEFDNIISFKHPLFKTSEGINENVIFGPEQLKKWNEKAYFIVPLVDKNNLFGIIKIEEISYMDVTASNVQVLMLLSKWIKEAIIKSWENALNRQQSIIDNTTGCLKENIFWTHVKRQTNAAILKKFDMSVLILKINSSKKVTDDLYFKLIVLIAKNISIEFRDHDETSVTGKGLNTKLYVLLPFTNKEATTIPLERVNMKLEKIIYAFNNKFKQNFNFSWEILSLSDGTLFLDDTIIEKIQAA